jgi:hypothetical protein
LDAVNPNDLRTRVEQAIFERIDPVTCERMREIEAAECESLQDILSRWQGSISGQAKRKTQTERGKVTQASKGTVVLQRKPFKMPIKGLRIHHV